MLAPCVLLVPVVAMAQTQSSTVNTRTSTNAPSWHPRSPVPAATGAAVDVSAGYVFINLDMPSSSRVNLSGINTTVAVNIFPHAGVAADFTYARASNLLGSGCHADLLSYLAGPVYYPLRIKKVTTLVHALIGGARVTGTPPGTNNSNFTGCANKLSWALGGGVHYQVSTSMALQVSSDYLHTTYFNSIPALKGQNDVRVVCGFVYSFWKHPLGTP